MTNLRIDLLTIDETRLVEVKDQKLLARIDSVIPSTIQAVANWCSEGRSAKVKEAESYIR